jgi:hypothetical protein
MEQRGSIIYQGVHMVGIVRGSEQASLNKPRIQSSVSSSYITSVVCQFSGYALAQLKVSSRSGNWVEYLQWSFLRHLSAVRVALHVISSLNCKYLAVITLLLCQIYRVNIDYRRISLRHNLSRKCRKIVKFVPITHGERNIWNGPGVATAILREKRKPVLDGNGCLTDRA